MRYLHRNIGSVPIQSAVQWTAPQIVVAVSAPPKRGGGWQGPRSAQLPDALAESARRLVVRKVGKLRLDGLREVRVFDDGIHRLFAQKVGVELQAYTISPTHTCQGQSRSRGGSRDGEEGRTLLVSAADSTLGLNGGWIFFCMSFLKSMCLAKNGCDLIDSAPVTPNRC